MQCRKRDKSTTPNSAASVRRIDRTLHAAVRAASRRGSRGIATDFHHRHAAFGDDGARPYCRQPFAGDISGLTRRFRAPAALGGGSPHDFGRHHCAAVVALRAATCQVARGAGLPRTRPTPRTRDPRCRFQPGARAPDRLRGSARERRGWRQRRAPAWRESFSGALLHVRRTRKRSAAAGNRRRSAGQMRCKFRLSWFMHAPSVCASAVFIAMPHRQFILNH